MCSIGEDDFGDEGGVHAMIPDEKLAKHNDLTVDLASQFCNKCNEPGAVFKLPFRHPECRECFLLHVRHKFRAALGSSKVLPKNAKVILVFDGTAESMVLLDMLHHAQTQNTFKRLYCRTTVLYIDEFQLLDESRMSDHGYKKCIEEVQLFLKQYTYFENFIVPLVSVNEVMSCITKIESINDKNYYVQHDDKQKSLITSINAIKSQTSRQDFVKHHRSKIIAAVAKRLDSKFAFMSDISPNLASDLLVAVALGRGGSAALDVALADDRLGNDIKLIRPLKDLNAKEIELYLKAQNLEPLHTIRYGLDVGSTGSLQNLTKSFVNNLQQNFSATISTVFRTGDKIAVNTDVIPRLQKLDLDDADDNVNSQNNKCCAFCNSFLDYQNSTALLAIEYSRLVSESSFTFDKCAELNAKAKQNVQGSIEKSYMKYLCHACRNICIDAPNESLLM